MCELCESDDAEPEFCSEAPEVGAEEEDAKVRNEERVEELESGAFAAGPTDAWSASMAVDSESRTSCRERWAAPMTAMWLKLLRLAGADRDVAREPCRCEFVVVFAVFFPDFGRRARRCR